VTRSLIVAPALALASCALPSNVSIANRVMLDGARAGFQACALSVEFGGAPRALYDSEAARYASGIDRKAQIDGLTWEGTNLVQTAVCACREAPFSNADIRQAEQSFARSPDVKMVPVAGRPFARRVMGLDTRYTEQDSSGDQALIVFPQNAPRCVFILGGKFEATGANALKAFFATLEPIGK
jgi:hypothetical protein